MWSFGAKPSLGKGDGGKNAPPIPPKKMDSDNCQHNVLVKRIKEGEEVQYRCMRCGQPFRKPDEIPRVQYQGGTK